VKDGRRKTEDGKYEKYEESMFDLAIDRAVREMLDVDPPAGLRARVIARLPVASAFRRKDLLRKDLFKRKAWMLVPIAAALILFILRPWHTSPARPQPAPVVARTAPIATPPVNRQPPSEPMRAAVVRPPSREDQAPPRSRGVTAAAESAAIDASASNIAPLDAISPITVPPVRPSNFAPTQISIAPLSPITEIQIAPLFPPERRN
jgi:hypothetical protein